MRNRRTAVLGGSGFIGRYVVKRLAARGEVIAVGCRNAEQAKFLKPMGDVGQIVPLNVSINDERLLPGEADAAGEAVWLGARSLAAAPAGGREGRCGATSCVAANARPSDATTARTAARPNRSVQPMAGRRTGCGSGTSPTCAEGTRGLSMR